MTNQGKRFNTLCRNCWRTYDALDDLRNKNADGGLRCPSCGCNVFWDVCKIIDLAEMMSFLKMYFPQTTLALKQRLEKSRNVWDLWINDTVPTSFQEAFEPESEAESKAAIIQAMRKDIGISA